MVIMHSDRLPEKQIRSTKLIAQSVDSPYSPMPQTLLA